MTEQEAPVIYSVIANFVAPGSSVLDLGCGTGDLLLHLKAHRNISGRGVDIGEDMVHTCIARGISVFQGDLDEGLKEYGSQSYDYVILSQTLQMVKNPYQLLTEMLRVGRHVIVNFPNFGYWRVRLGLLVGGRMPVTRSLPYQWFNTPNIHLCTRNDFVNLCDLASGRIVTEVSLRNGKPFRTALPNLKASESCFLIAPR